MSDIKVSEEVLAYAEWNSPWQEKEKQQWFEQQTIKRSYAQEVVQKITPLVKDFDIDIYGELPINPKKYPLYLLRSKNWQTDKPTILVTGGVHGYETSGVQGALRFAATEAKTYSQQFNFIIAPCLSPWGYETINRWNPNAIDPNRSFYQDSPAEESALLMQAVEKLNVDILAHFDLHETTDTDNSVFRPALAARDGITQDNWNIPDGFYLVGDSETPNTEFQKAIIDSVRKVTHIAPADSNGKIIGAPLEQEGVINYPTRKLSLCAGFSNRQYCTTTEMYPDSPNASPEECILAQVASITGGLDYLKNI